mmetsp:Transcript_8557/g.21957  ORF Transcript_8557/g.21957 Transcript_8557/m.21957 type:complete len:201 (-) Transcript_8557:1091-1693(-)
MLHASRGPHAARGRDARVRARPSHDRHGQHARDGLHRRARAAGTGSQAADRRLPDAGRRLPQHELAHQPRRQHLIPGRPGRRAGARHVLYVLLPGGARHAAGGGAAGAHHGGAGARAGDRGPQVPGLAHPGQGAHGDGPGRQGHRPGAGGGAERDGQGGRRAARAAGGAAAGGRRGGPRLLCSGRGHAHGRAAPRPQGGG